MFGEVIFFQNFLEFWKVRKILSRHGGVLSTFEIIQKPRNIRKTKFHMLWGESQENLVEDEKKNARKGYEKDGGGNSPI